MLAVTVAT